MSNWHGAPPSSSSSLVSMLRHLMKLIAGLWIIFFAGLLCVFAYACTSPSKPRQTNVKDQATVVCQVTAARMAKWGYEIDPVPNGVLTIRNGIVYVSGAHDVRFGNAFGAYAYVEYDCVYDPASATATIVSLAGYQRPS